MSKEKTTEENAEKKKYPGYPPYQKKDDIFNKDEEEQSINPEETDKVKSSNAGRGSNEKNFGKEMGSDLDVPGAELDDKDEDIGEEDEENNFYSLGDND